MILVSPPVQERGGQGRIRREKDERKREKRHGSDGKLITLLSVCWSRKTDHMAVSKNWLRRTRQNKTRWDKTYRQLDVANL